MDSIHPSLDRPYQAGIVAIEPHDIAKIRHRKRNRTPVMIRLRLQMLAPLSIRKS